MSLLRLARARRPCEKIGNQRHVPAGKRFVLKTCGSPTWDSQNILYMHAPEYNANLKMAQDNFEGNLCLAATGSVNEDVIETAICDGNDKYQAWQLKVIEELPQHLDDEYGGH